MNVGGGCIFNVILIMGGVNVVVVDEVFVVGECGEFCVKGFVLSFAVFDVFD